MNKLAQFLFLSTLSIAAGSPFNLRRRTESAACSDTELDGFSCALIGDNSGEPSGAYVCRQGFRACIHPADHEDGDSCGSCDPVAVPAPEPKKNTLSTVFVPPPLCFYLDLDDYSCSLGDGSGKEGTLICEEGFSACVPTSEILDFDFCGCCKGDNALRCKSSATQSDPFVIQAPNPEPSAESSNADPFVIELRTARTNPSASCSAKQLDTFACPLVDDRGDETSGAYVCRHAFTACLSPDDHKAGDRCGICPAVVRVPESRDEPTSPASPPPRCTDVDLDDYPCALGDGSEMDGTQVCTGGFSACIPSGLAAIMDRARCGCCAGDKSPRCV